MKSIKGRLILMFFIIIATLTAGSLFFFALNLSVIQQYKAISDTTIAEYRLVDTSSALITAYNVRIQSAGTDTTTSDQKINDAKSEIRNLMLYLDNNITDTDSLSNYIGLKSSINKLVGIIEKSLQKDNIQDYTSDYNNADKVYGFVRDNGTILIFSELKYASFISKTIDRNNFISVGFGLSALLVLVLGCTLFAIRFARKFTQPLIGLTVASGQIADGNMEVTIDPKILKEPNELCSLAQSFNTMAITLRDKISQLNQAKKKAEENLAEVERMNSLMVGRETKMLELKKEIHVLREKQGLPDQKEDTTPTA